MTTTAFRPVTPFDLGGLLPRGSPERLRAYALTAAASFVAYILGRLVEGPLSTAFAAFGVSACGWSWLLARALFDPSARDARWPRVVVLVLMTCGAASVLVPGSSVGSGVVNNLYALSGSGALLMTFVEPFQRHGCDLTRGEVRFRTAFVVVFGLLVGASVLAAWTTPDRVEVICAAVGLAGIGIALQFRLHHPLACPERLSATRRLATQDDALLADRLRRLLRDEAIHLDPDVRISGVAARLGVAEHRVSRCISAATGFANFNRLINHHRVEEAKRLLAAPAGRRSILQIALDSGFASVGPFNRAFRDATGMTPKAYRNRQRSAAGLPA